MHTRKNKKSAIPPELNGCKVITWDWKSLEKIIKQF